jgi:hypothetical protein
MRTGETDQCTSPMCATSGTCVNPNIHADNIGADFFVWITSGYTPRTTTACSKEGKEIRPDSVNGNGLSESSTGLVH